MRILFLSHYFPPEVNAPANRTLEHCREWVRLGHEVHVVTCFPSHPRGKLYDGFKLRWYQRDIQDGVIVHRVPTWIAPNTGVLQRFASYTSYVPAALFRGCRLGRFDWIVATSPQIMVAVAGWILSGIKRCPWAFELRDLWPESLVSVGPTRGSRLLALLESLELRLYRSAEVVFCVTRAFVDNLQRRGIPADKLIYIPNGMLPQDWEPTDKRLARSRLGIAPEELVVSYVGTVGFAHGLHALLDAAEEVEARGLRARWLIVGDGAERRELEALAGRRGLTQVRFVGLVSRDLVREIYSATDIAAVLLRDRPVFRTVIPSKLLEGMAAGLPIVLGVHGEAEDILRGADAGIVVQPENSSELADAVVRMASSEQLRRDSGANGRQYVNQHFHRARWAARMVQELEDRSSIRPL